MRAERLSNVVIDQCEVALDQVVYVLLSSGEEVVDANDEVSLGEQDLAETRANEAGSADHGDDLPGMSRRVVATLRDIYAR